MHFKNLIFTDDKYVSYSKNNKLLYNKNLNNIISSELLGQRMNTIC